MLVNKRYQVIQDGNNIASLVRSLIIYQRTLIEYTRTRVGLLGPDFLGTNNVAFKDRDYLPFIEAREYARKLEFQNRSQWEQYCKSGNKPGNIPSRPDVIYDGEWKRHR